MPEAHAIEPLHELDGVAGFAALAGHAAEEAFSRRHDEIRGFLVVVEGAKPGPVGALALQGGPSRLDQGHEVGFGFDAGDFSIRYSGHCFVLAGTKRPPALPFRTKRRADWLAFSMRAKW